MVAPPEANAAAATGAILAGGRSRRMGCDKLPLKVGGVALLDRVRDALSPPCEEVLIVGGTRHAPAGTRSVPDLRPDRRGPLAGIEAALLAARHESIFVAAADMPFLTRGLVGYLLGLLSESVTAAVPRYDGRVHPLCAAYRRGVARAAGARLDADERSVHGLLDRLPGVRYVGDEELRRFGDPDLLLANVNSPEDLARARATLSNGGA